jgi:poly [ADP-ribose] polymerase
MSIHKKIKPKQKRQWSIYRDYNVTLNLTDINYGVKGHNKYYKIKIIHCHGIYKMLIEWGRVGARNPGKRTETFANAETAIKAFEKKFHSKT